MKIDCRDGWVNVSEVSDDYEFTVNDFMEFLKAISSRYDVANGYGGSDGHSMYIHEVFARDWRLNNMITPRVILTTMTLYTAVPSRMFIGGPFYTTEFALLREIACRYRPIEKKEIRPKHVPKFAKGDILMANDGNFIGRVDCVKGQDYVITLLSSVKPEQDNFDVIYMDSAFKKIGKEV